MAKPKTSEPLPKEASLPSATAESLLSRYLDKNKTEHYNYVPDTDYLVSTGSLNLDSEIGCFGPGMVRLCGNASAGKSSFALNVARNFLDTVPHSRVLYVKCEARLSKEIQDRSGLTFIKDPKEWRDGTVFVFECNVYEVIIGLLRELVTDNPTKCVYMIILDSMDGLNLRADITRPIDESNKVAGAALMTTQFLQKMSVAMTKYGHLCMFLSQVRTEIRLDPYAKAGIRQVASAGGAAIQHYASHVLFFQDWHEGDLILEKPDERADRIKNRSLGHICKIKLAKTDKEKRHIVVEIPIKHGVVNGSSVWKEREISDQLFGWGLVSKKGSWITLSDVLRKELTEHKLDGAPEQIQGLNQLHAFLESHQDITAYLFNRFKNMNSGTEPAPVVPSS